jgi:hypothetical protein
MNYFDYSIISNELWFYIFDFIKDERTLGRVPRVCQQWRQVTYDPHFKAWFHPYRCIWQEIPRIGAPSPFETARQAFQQRFTFVHLDQVGKAFGRAISSVADKILAIRQTSFQEDPPVTSMGQYHSLQFWQQKFSQAYQARDLLGQIYVGKELQLLFKARNQERELSVLRMGCLQRIVDPEISVTEKIYFNALFFALFNNSQALKAFILQYPEPYDILYNSVKHGFNNFITVYLEANSEVMIREAPLFLAEAADNHQFETMRLMLTHRPAIPCLTVDGAAQETGLHNLCTLLEEEVIDEDFVTWQALAQELVSRGCHPLYQDEIGRTSLHRAISKSNFKFLNWLIETYGPFSPELFNELKQYFFDQFDSRSDRATTDENYEDELNILRILLAHYPLLRNQFDLSYDLCWYPWILPALIESADPQTPQLDIQVLFKHLLSTPALFIHDLLNNYNVKDYLFLQSEVVAEMAIFERQIDRLITGDLFFNYIHPEGQNSIQLLILSLREIEKTLNRKLKNKAVVKKLFSICRMTYQSVIQKIITQQNYKNPNPAQVQPIDSAKQYQYDELQGILMLFELNLIQSARPMPPEKRPRIQLNEDE